MKYLAGVLFGFFSITAFSQQMVSGYVLDKHNSEALPLSTIFISGNTIGTSANSKGYFELNVPKELVDSKLVVSFIGYQSDTVTIPNSGSLKVFLLPSPNALNEVVISGTMKEMSKLDSPIPVEVYNATFFKKNPTPNIFESLTMVNGIQPQLNCNVCNTGDIHINGMEGPYTMVLIDGMPIVSSLSTVYGLSGIPNSMVKRIEIVKGPASTLYGSEAVGGLINIITKDPLTSPTMKMDLMATSLQEFNGDLSTKFKVKGATSMLGLNGFWFNKLLDVNSDGFTDLTIQKRFSVFNKWDFARKSGKNTSLAVRYVHENRWGGQTNWTDKYRGSDSIYGESIYTNRFELIGNYELPIKSQNIRIQYSYNTHYQDSYYGTVKYLANQQTAFAQLLWDKSIGHHNLLFGLPFRFVYYDDNSPATANLDLSNKPQLTFLPGIFAQDEWRIHKKFTTLVGLRYDRNNEHGNIFTPRLSFKYSPNNYNTFRLSGGNGYRVVNLFTEDHAALTGARIVEIREALKPEQSWNVNLNYANQIYHKAGFVGIDFSVFYTYFTNKIVADYLTDANKIIYDNLKGYAISKGFTLNTDFSFTNGLKIMAGATLMDVYQIEKDSSGTEVRKEQQFAPKFSGTYAVSYTFNKLGLNIDWTGRVNGPMYLPIQPNDFRPELSPWFCIMNLQVTKTISKNVEVYGGGKNLLNFIPANPIIRSNDPFDKNISVNNPNGYTFDPSYNYAPVQGIKFYLGVRWTID